MGKYYDKRQKSGQTYLYKRRICGVDHMKDQSSFVQILRLTEDAQGASRMNTQIPASTHARLVPDKQQMPAQEHAEAGKAEGESLFKTP